MEDKRTRETYESERENMMKKKAHNNERKQAKRSKRRNVLGKRKE
jgi:hypothetical protein